MSHFSLAPGTTLGPYTIDAAIGAGGMGEVYRATDATLRRHVAIKVLPASLAGNRERLGRFQREAEILASLNHPNIAAVYGLEHRDGLTGLVMELVDGEDLSHRIARGAVPVEEALSLAAQVAAALEAAHERGVVHRDLKPANIKVREDGTAKVLDFGLAKARDSQPASEAGSPSPTMTAPAFTQAGAVLGTAAYMSPEQARGRPVDERADVWALGAVLFEMLTATRAFPGSGVGDTLAAVLGSEPDWARLPPDLPPSVRVFLERSLEKDTAKRLRAAGDLRLALQGAFDLTEQPSPGQALPQGAATAPRWSRVLPWAVAAAFAAATGIVALRSRQALPAPDLRPLVRLQVDLGPEVSLPPPEGGGTSIAISPDSTRLAYLSGTPRRLFIRRLDQKTATELQGTQGANVPLIFSPDGRWIGFVWNGRASKVSVEGGAVLPVSELDGVTRAWWASDGSLFAMSAQRLQRIPARGGAPELVATPRNGEITLVGPQLLPGGRAVLLAADNPGTVDKTTVDVVTVADGQRRTVLRGGASPRYVESSTGQGYLLYVNQSTLFAIHFDLESLTTAGTAVPLVDDVAHGALIGSGDFVVGSDGTLIYRRDASGGPGLATLQRVAADGSRETLRASPAPYQAVSISPDGQRLAVSVLEGGSEDVWVYDMRRDATTRLTVGGGQYRFPVWSPNGQHVAIGVLGQGIFQARADGAGPAQPLTRSATVQYPSGFAPDGRHLAYSEMSGGIRQLWSVELREQGGRLTAGMPLRFLESRFNDVTPSYSPDGRWLAYSSVESGASEVYVRPFPPVKEGVSRKWQVSNSGGVLPHWSRPRRDLIYQAETRLMAAHYSVTDDTFQAERPRVWIDGVAATASLPTWDLDPDGAHVVAVVPVSSGLAVPNDHEVVFLQNFVDELTRRLPH